MSLLCTFILPVLTTTTTKCVITAIYQLKTHHIEVFILLKRCMHLWRRLLSKLSPSHIFLYLKHRSHHAIVNNCCWFLKWNIFKSQDDISLHITPHWCYYTRYSINLSLKWIHLFTTLRFQCLSYLLMMFLY